MGAEPPCARPAAGVSRLLLRTSPMGSLRRVISKTAHGTSETVPTVTSTG
jgi:hypothetical protein